MHRQIYEFDFIHSPHSCHPMHAKFLRKRSYKKPCKGLKKKKRNTNLSCILIFGLTILIHKHPQLAVFSLIITVVLQPQAKQCKELNFANIVNRNFQNTCKLAQIFCLKV